MSIGSSHSLKYSLRSSSRASTKSCIVTANAALATGFHHISWATSDSGRTITVTHNTCAYASIASAPAADDVTVQIHFLAVVELADIPGAGI
jgi:hypothetical protein